MRRAVVWFLAAALLCAGAPTALSAARRPAPVEIGEGLRIYNPKGPGDATVVAVIDFNFVPYHWDFLASRMPQQLDKDGSNDLPLTSPPDEWLPGFPSRGALASYEKLDVKLEEKNPDAPLAAIAATEKPKWDKVKQSTSEKVNYYWLPGTKVIGAVDFGGNKILGASDDHGQGTASSSVGNLHGTCPECLLVFINIAGKADGEAAIEWAMAQPWIDVITNSYGFSLAARDRLYSGSNVKAQRRASERGQTIFFSAGNGQDGAFVAPNTTSFSSQEGPDWIVTVGAVSPGEDNYYYRKGYLGDQADKLAYHASYSGHGKPADIAGIGSNYPTSYGADSVSGTGRFGFGGTSNATPQVAGTYSRALYLARRDLRGVSRTQTSGVIATGRGFRCGRARADCELGDGRLTATELRERLFHGALHTPAGMTPAGYGTVPKVGEDEFLNEGHGSYFGRETGRTKDWLKEFDRIMAPLEGRAKTLDRPDGEHEWMIVDSYCRQHLWGFWKHGYYVEDKTELPGADPAYPIRSALEPVCPHLIPPV
ncbi:MAG TPA: S8/S53 family peptidase [Actinomycetota bacterium]|nr:S8/S53 family peptidase [Actinomycetota bacterium]